MGQILSGNKKNSRKENSSSLSSGQHSQYGQYNQYNFDRESSRWKTENTISTPKNTQRSYNVGDSEWFKKICQDRQQEAVNLYKERQQEKAPQMNRNPPPLPERKVVSQVNRNPFLLPEKKLVHASQVNKNLPPPPLIERKITSGEKDNVPYNFVITSVEKKTFKVKENPRILPTTSKRKMTPEVKDSTSSLSHLSTNLRTKGNQTSLSDHTHNISSTSEENTTPLSKDDLENIKRITQIIRNVLAHNINYVVYGNWSCPHWPRPCDNEDEWQCKYSRETLQKYLKLNSVNKHDFFMKSCKGCNKKSLVSSFFLYDQQPKYAYKEPTVEIVCRLVWKNHYRVFAEWKCKRPQSPRHEWKSSYTWISLQNFIEKTPLKEGNYYVQNCHDCREECKVCKHKPKEKRGCKECDHDTAVLNYSQLLQSSGGKPHKRWLCAKCKGGSICRSDNNYRVPRKRNIELFQ